MSVLILYAHPNPTSFTHAVLERVICGLERAGTPHEVIDLYADGFDPRLVVDETHRRRDLIRDPETARYREALVRADHVVHVYPVWWGSFPAILKGFLDRVYASGLAYSFEGRPRRAVFPRGLFGAKRASFFYTLDSPWLVAWADPNWWGNLFTVFRYCGYRTCRRHFLSRLKLTSPAIRARWLDQVEDIAASL